MPKAVSKKTRNIIETLFKNLDDRQKKILKGRYGLDSGEELALAELGKLFSVTRERIRQIEASALKEVRHKAQSGHLSELTETVLEKLNKSGGVMKENHLLEKIDHFSNDADLLASFAQQVRFLLEVSRTVLHHKEDDSLHSHWHLSQEHQEIALKFLNDLVKKLKGKKKEVLEKKKFEDFFQEVLKINKLEKEVAQQYLKISKKFGKNIYGDFGLTDWEEVEPKVARDWIYLILKKAGKAMHFSDIASEIRKLRDSKRTNTQTIHNELIKDKRFILVGRGMYTLREFDDIPAGTIKDVLVHILKKNGPMTTKEIIKSVLENRIFKENTIIFNLQNKKYFQREKGGKYTLA